MDTRNELMESAYWDGMNEPERKCWGCEHWEELHTSNFVGLCEDIVDDLPVTGGRFEISGNAVADRCPFFEPTEEWKIYIEECNEKRED